jgi:ribose-phosphate pyrophosphokinase
VLLDAIRSRNQGPLTIVSPDAGGVERSRAYAKRLGAQLAMVDKRREAPNVSEVMNVVGDVEGRTCVIVDDIVDTAGTLTQAAHALRREGAVRVTAAVTHPVLSGPAIKRIEESALEELVVTDTIQLRDDARECRKLRPVSIAPLLGEAIRRINNEESVSSLFV